MEDCKGMHTDFYNKHQSLSKNVLNNKNTAKPNEMPNNPLEVGNLAYSSLESGCKE